MTARVNEIAKKVNDLRSIVESEGYYMAMIGGNYTFRTYELRFRPVLVPADVEEFEGRAGDLRVAIPIHEKDTKLGIATRSLRSFLCGLFVVLWTHLLWISSRRKDDQISITVVVLKKSPQTALRIRWYVPFMDFSCLLYNHKDPETYSLNV